MRRIGTVLALVPASVLLFATSALAQYPPNKSADPGDPGDPGVAFTGASISVGLVILAALVILGTLFFFLGRRRRVE